jgi:CheY-like chemotaxis protein
MVKLPRDILAGWDVLLIEDEPDSADVACRVLRFFGANVQVAANGMEGLNLLRTFRPRLIICDISMPVLDGWGVIEALNNDRELSNIPAIALTAHAMLGDREKAVAAGFHNYLTKPLTPVTFVHDLLSLVIDLPQFKEVAEKMGEL